jgi:hypothetical protein
MIDKFVMTILSKITVREAPRLVLKNQHDPTGIDILKTPSRKRAELETAFSDTFERIEEL